MRTKTWTGLVVLAIVALVAMGLAPVVAADGAAAAQDNETQACEADIDNFDVHTSDDTIEGADDPGRVGVSASTSMSNGCDVRIQVTFDIPNNMYYQGTSADASGQGLQTETFTVQPGDVSSFTTELFANQEGEHTVVADVEYFPEGQPEDSRTLDNFMLTFNAVDTGFPSDADTSGEGDGTDDSEETTTSPNGNNGEGIMNFIEDNFGLLGIFFMGMVALGGLVVVAVRDEPVLNVFTGK